MIAGKGLAFSRGTILYGTKAWAVENYVRFSPDLRNRRNLRFQIRNSSLLPMLNRLDRRRAKPGRPVVPEEGEFQPAAAEQIPRLKRVTKAESTSANLYSSGRTIGSRTLELNVLSVDYGEYVICMLRNNSEGVARI